MTPSPTPSRSLTPAGLAGILVLAGAAALAGCQTAPGGGGYELIGTETVTDPQSGVRKQIRHWRHANGNVTQSTKVVYNPQRGSPSARGGAN